VKTGLIAHDRKFDFITQTQSLMNALSNITATDNHCKGSAFSGCFFQAIQAVCGLDRTLDGCVWLYSSLVLDYDLCFKIPFILVISFEP